MLQVSVEFPTYNIDTEKITKVIDKGLRDLFKDALLYFVQAFEGQVPILSGQAIGTLNAIIKTVGLVYDLNTTPDSPYADEQVGGVSRVQYMRERGQTPEAGQSQALVEYGLEGDEFVFNFDLSGFSSPGGSNYFAHWEVNPTNNPIKPGPWQAFSSGEQALVSFFETIDINDYIKASFDDENIIIINGKEIIN